MLKKEHYANMWCPWGRISIQKVESGNIKAVDTGAFNQIMLSTQQTYLSARCMGDKCPYYKRGINPWSWGYCLMSPQRTGKYIIIAAMLILAGILLSHYLS